MNKISLQRHDREKSAAIFEVGGKIIIAEKNTVKPDSCITLEKAYSFNKKNYQ